MSERGVVDGDGRTRIERFRVKVDELKARFRIVYWTVEEVMKESRAFGQVVRFAKRMDQLFRRGGREDG